MHQTVRKLTNWKAPGMDQGQNYWYKYMPALHQRLCDVLNGIILHPEHLLQWLLCGLTTLIHKKEPENIPKNNQLITCLPTLYKHITLIFTDRVFMHLVAQDILPPEQKGVKLKTRGCKDHLLLDKLILEQTKEELKRALQIIENFSRDINMTFGLDTCAILLMSNGKYTTTNICPEILKLDNEDNKGYWHLDTTEGVDFHMKKVKDMTIKEYISWGRERAYRVENTHNCECATLAKYVLNSTDPLTQMVQNAPTPTQKFLHKFALSLKFMLPELTDDNQYKCLSKKPLHDKFFCQQAEILQVNLIQSHQWLGQAQLWSETKTEICAA
eukprot:1055577-Ditylum_brightwellii.AAC.1